jgi:hypothetical protein
MARKAGLFRVERAPYILGAIRRPERAGTSQDAVRDYEALLRLNIRPVPGSRLIGTITQIDMQSVYAQMLDRGLSARTIEYTNAVLRSAFRQAVRWKNPAMQFMNEAARPSHCYR